MCACTLVSLCALPKLFKGQAFDLEVMMPGRMPTSHIEVSDIPVSAQLSIRAGWEERGLFPPRYPPGRDLG